MGAGTAIAAGNSATGGTIRTGGTIVGTLLFWHALSVCQKARAVGGPTSAAGRLVVGVGVIACLGVRIPALIATDGSNSRSPTTNQAPTDSGNCWIDASGDMIK